MSQKKTLGTVAECTEICDESISLLEDANRVVLSNTEFSIEECGKITKSDEKDRGKWIHMKPSRLNFASLFRARSHRKYKRYIEM
ncbi:hypothetical protein X798_03634 [Onchocerca flexuosa]|uniref:Uncharacterized protein n=2 Tax=Onchocerca flexuosa TaxID=387005 RepID=A0A183HZQ3_9BILA|nr:hypothetical protein X798_03634 [Onchocerca flexuosa]VDP12605.1 unnamed protein product [Onchocerca flexuosa]